MLKFCVEEGSSFDLTFVNPNDPEWLYHVAMVNLDNLTSRGSGRTKRKAEERACENFINGNYLCGWNPIHLGNRVTPRRTRKAPSKKRKDKQKLLERIAKMRANATAPSASPEKPETPNLPVNQRPIVAYDTERAAGPHNSEMIELSYTSEQESGQFFIKPMGRIDKIASDLSCQITVVRGKMYKKKIEVEHVTLKEACEKFIIHLEMIGKSGKKPIIACHGEDLLTLLNSMAYVGLEERLMSAIGGHLNFYEVVANDPMFDGKSKSLVKLDVDENLSEQILGKQVRREIEENAHDAEFDSNLLLRVMKGYFEGEEARLEKYVKEPSEELVGDCRRRMNRIANKMEKKRILAELHGTSKNKGLVYISGWERTFVRY